MFGLWASVGYLGCVAGVEEKALDCGGQREFTDHHHKHHTDVCLWILRYDFSPGRGEDGGGC